MSDVGPLANSSEYDGLDVRDALGTSEQVDTSC